MAERQVTMKGNPLPLSGSPAAPGQPAPDFTAVRGDMSPFRLADERGKVVVINAVPSLDTPVCQVQTRRFNDEASRLGPNVKVVVVSMDLPFAQKRFCTIEGLANVEAVSDHRDAAFGKNWGMLIDPLRLLARGVFVVDPAGTLRYAQVVPEVTDEPNYDEALAAVKQIL